MEELFYIDGYYLDKYQIECIKYNRNLLIVAGAGSGKTSTILGKVKYLINNGYSETDILCISLTNDATNSLKNKLLNIGFDITCYTFHKLSYNILKNYDSNINICSDNYLEYIVDEYFNSIVRFSFRRYYLLIKFKCMKFDSIINSVDFTKYKRYLVTYINLIKNKGYDIEFIKKEYRNNLLKYDYMILIEIYLIYKRELESTSSYDFNDLIYYASSVVKKNNIILPYKYIIIDEFQDTSYIRLDLINNIIKNNNAKIMCVGDDYQSIYKFAGSDVKLFLNFTKYICDSKIMYLKNTYRNSSELLYISTNFICKNKHQLKKELFSSKHNSKPIKIFYCDKKIDGLRYLVNLVGDDYLVLGRNNFDINKYVEKNKDINNYNYMTIHKSKGLESNNIILINLTNDVNGFPSKKEVPKFISNLFDKDLYKYEEERRLFYVALTRTKNSVYFLLEKGNESIFVKEVIKDYSEFIEYIKK